MARITTEMTSFFFSRSLRLITLIFEDCIFYLLILALFVGGNLILADFSEWVPGNKTRVFVLFLTLLSLASMYALYVEGMSRGERALALGHAILFLCFGVGYADAMSRPVAEIWSAAVDISLYLLLLECLIILYIFLFDQVAEVRLIRRYGSPSK